MVRALKCIRDGDQDLKMVMRDGDQCGARRMKSESSRTLISVHPGISSMTARNRSAPFCRCSLDRGTYGRRNTGLTSPHMAMAVFLQQFAAMSTPIKQETNKKHKSRTLESDLARRTARQSALAAFHSLHHPWNSLMRRIIPE